MPSEPRRHHLVPKFYLAQWGRAEEAGRVWWLMIEAGREVSVSPADAMVDRDFYRDARLASPAAWEGFIAEREGGFAAHVKRLGTLEIGDPLWPRVTDNRDRVSIADFVALQMLRGRDFREAYASARNSDAGSLIDANGTTDDTRWLWDRWGIGVRHQPVRVGERLDPPSGRHATDHLEGIATTWPAVFTEINQRPWRIFVFPSMQLWTSDRPVVYLAEGLAEVVRAEFSFRRQLYVPISPRVALITVSPRDWNEETRQSIVMGGFDGVARGNSEIASQLNQHLARAAERFLIGCGKGFGAQALACRDPA